MGIVSTGIREKLRYWLGRADMSERQLARQLGVNQKTAWGWLNGRHNPRLSQLPRIAAVFGLSQAAFLAELPEGPA